ncbi:MAG: hypothetical protein R6W79_11365 [Acidimicrobiia bacterium]
MMGHTTPSAAKPRIASTMGKAAIFSEALPIVEAILGFAADGVVCPIMIAPR